MKVLITGGVGYLGSALTAYLLEKKMQVVVYDKLLFGAEGISSFLPHPNFRLVVGDIRDTQALKAACGQVTAIVHLAALVGETACEVDRQATSAINSEATLGLAKIAAKIGIKRMIFSSTCSNYGLVDRETLACEDTPLKPLSLYAQTKIAAEKSLQAVSQGKLAICILRFGTICGVSARMRFNLLINDLARRAASGRDISIFAPRAWRPFLHINDAVGVIYRCLTAPSAKISGEIFNVVSENCQKQKLIKLTHKYFPRAKVEVRPGKSDPRDYRVSGAHVGRKLKFLPKHGVEEAFVEVATAVKNGLWSDPFRDIYEAVPTKHQLKK